MAFLWVKPCPASLAFPWRYDEDGEVLTVLDPVAVPDGAYPKKKWMYREINLRTLEEVTSFAFGGRRPYTNVHFLDDDRFLVVHPYWVALGRRGEAEPELLWQRNAEGRKIGKAEQLINVKGTDVFYYDPLDYGIWRQDLFSKERTRIALLDELKSVGVTCYRDHEFMVLHSVDLKRRKSLYKFDTDFNLINIIEDPEFWRDSFALPNSEFDASPRGIFSRKTGFPVVLLSGRYRWIEPLGDQYWLYWSDAHIHLYSSDFRYLGKQDRPGISNGDRVFSRLEGRNLVHYYVSSEDTYEKLDDGPLSEFQLPDREPISLAPASEAAIHGLKRPTSATIVGDESWTYELTYSEQGLPETTIFRSYKHGAPLPAGGFVFPKEATTIIPGIGSSRVLLSTPSDSDSFRDLYDTWLVDLEKGKARLILERIEDTEPSGKWFTDQFFLNGRYCLNFSGEIVYALSDKHYSKSFYPLPKERGFATEHGELYPWNKEEGEYERMDLETLTTDVRNPRFAVFPDARHALVLDEYQTSTTELIELPGGKVVDTIDSDGSFILCTEGVFQYPNIYRPMEDPANPIYIGKKPELPWLQELYKPNLAGGLTQFHRLPPVQGRAYYQARSFNPRTENRVEGYLAWPALKVEDWLWIKGLDYCRQLGEGWYWSNSWGNVYLYYDRFDSLSLYFHNHGSTYGSFANLDHYLYDYGTMSWKYRYSELEETVILFDFDYGFWQRATSEKAPDFLNNVRLRLDGGEDLVAEFWRFKRKKVGVYTQKREHKVWFQNFPYTAEKLDADTLAVNFSPNEELGLLKLHYVFEFSTKFHGRVEADYRIRDINGKITEGTVKSTFQLIRQSEW